MVHGCSRRLQTLSYSKKIDHLSIVTTNWNLAWIEYKPFSHYTKSSVLVLEEETGFAITVLFYDDAALEAELHWCHWCLTSWPLTHFTLCLQPLISETMQQSPVLAATELNHCWKSTQPSLPNWPICFFWLQNFQNKSFPPMKTNAQKNKTHVESSQLFYSSSSQTIRNAHNKKDMNSIITRSVVIILVWGSR